MIVFNRQRRTAAIAAAAFALAAATAIAAPLEPVLDSPSKIADNSPYDPLASRYENTVIVTGANTAKTKLNYNKDGTLTVAQANAALKTAKWSRTSGQFCVAFTGGATRCGALGDEPEALVMSALVARADAKAESEQNAVKETGGKAAPVDAEPVKVMSVGDTWTMTLPGGEKLKVRILAGR
jgi:hypothetical protein